MAASLKEENSRLAERTRTLERKVRMSSPNQLFVQYVL
jgi:hypothetical protein